MIAALVQGTLAGDPAERSAANGSPFWTANLRVPAGAESMFLGLATFDAIAGARLMKLSKGSALAATGVFEQTAWQDKEGNERAGWRLTASEILSVNQARKRRTEEPAA